MRKPKGKTPRRIRVEGTRKRAEGQKAETWKTPPQDSGKNGMSGCAIALIFVGIALLLAGLGLYITCKSMTWGI